MISLFSIVKIWKQTKIAVIILKFGQFGFTVQKYADRMGNSADLDFTTVSRACLSKYLGSLR